LVLPLLDPPELLLEVVPKPELELELDPLDELLVLLPLDELLELPLLVLALVALPPEALLPVEPVAPAPVLDEAAVPWPPELLPLVEAPLEVTATIAPDGLQKPPSPQAKSCSSPTDWKAQDARQKRPMGARRRIVTW
jgi:hypothetical protein